MKRKINLNIIHIILITIGVLFVFSSVFHTNIWFDEAYSVGMANHTIIDIWKIGSNDVHPVLYYWMLRIINLLTNSSIMAYRLFSALPIALLGILGVTHIKKDFGEKTGILFSFLSFFLPMMVVYANQIRMYSWAIYFVTVLAIYAYRIYLGQNTKKNWIVFGISSLASIYIHYYGLMVAGLINVFLLIYLLKNKRWKDLIWQVSLGICQVILYIPWLIALMSQMKSISGGFWITFTFPETLYELIGCQMAGIMDFKIGFIATILLLIILLAIILRKRKEKTVNWKPAIYSFIIYLSVILAAVIITKILKSEILYYRYLFVITGLYIFTISYILSKENNRYITIIICMLILVLSIQNYILQIKDNYDKSNSKPIEYLNENVQEGDIFVYNEVGSGFVCASIFTENNHYFYNKERWGVEEAYKAWAPQLQTKETTKFLENFEGRIWVISSWNNTCYEEIFNNKEYNLLSNKRFETKYQNYPYNIILVETVEK